jgi:hypothetical protein
VAFSLCEAVLRLAAFVSVALTAVECVPLSVLSAYLALLLRYGVEALEGSSSVAISQTVELQRDT